MTDIVDQIVFGGRCNGCGACAAAVPEARLGMAMSDAGYLRPVKNAPLSSDDEDIVRAVCGGNALAHPADTAVFYDPHWGPLVSVETAYSTDADTRYQGSSGGVISAVAIHLIETGEVDFVLQTAADPADPIGNATRASSSRSDVLAAAGSRYAPSAPLAEIGQHLAAGKRFAFVGKPCDVAALRRMAMRDPRIDKLVPYMIAFFCAGVPSRKGALAVLDKLGVQPKEVASFSFRGMGWPGLARATRHDGSQASMDYTSSWGKILNRHLQFRCKVCADGTGEFADIVCADAWYGEDGYPDFAERDGRSLLLARSVKGRSVLDAMVAGSKILSEPLDVSEIRRMQPYQFDRKQNLLARMLGMRLKGHRPPRYRGFRLWNLAVKTPPAVLLRSLVGTWRRVHRGRPLN